MMIARDVTAKHATHKWYSSKGATHLADILRGLSGWLVPVRVFHLRVRTTIAKQRAVDRAFQVADQHA